VLVVASYVTAEIDRIDLHMRCGYAVLTLLLFRLGWGVIGSESARFAQFVTGPGRVTAYLRHWLRSAADRYPGHNPAGGWAVVTMLGLLTFQAATGLGANDDVVYEGPLARHLGKRLSDLFSAVHDFNVNLLIGIVALHVAAVLAYRLVRGQDLIRPMVTGQKALGRGVPAPKQAGLVSALAVFLAAALIVWTIATRL
jgi:cytochrome b